MLNFFTVSERFFRSAFSHVIATCTIKAPFLFATLNVAHVEILYSSIFFVKLENLSQMWNRKPLTGTILPAKI